jgi:hypothetical protein
MTGNLAAEIRQEWLEEQAEADRLKRRYSALNVAPRIDPPWIADQPDYFPETATAASLRASLEVLHPTMRVGVQQDVGFFSVTIGPEKLPE